MFDDPSQYLKIEEAARLLGVSARTVYRWVWKGELPASKVGGLYFIPRSELQKRLDQSRPAGDAPARRAAEDGASRLALKCGACFQIIASDAQIGGLCRHAGCEQLICARCQAAGVDACAAHQLDRSARLDAARRRLEHGEIALLVRAETARLREISFISRIQARLCAVHALLHPATGELINVGDWDELAEAGDERLEVMRLLGKVILDADTLARSPLNPGLIYRLPSGKGQKGAPLEVRVQALSRLQPMLRDGFDTRPFGLEELTPLLSAAADELQRSSTFRLALIAASTGWDTEARRMVIAPEPGRSFIHRSALFYLYDLEKGELIYNAEDERARPYAELFAPLLPSEEIGEAVKAVEKQLTTYTSLTLSLAVETLPYSADVLRQAFERMAAGGRYALTHLPDLGDAIVRL